MKNKLAIASNRLFKYRNYNNNKVYHHYLWFCDVWIQQQA